MNVKLKILCTENNYLKSAFCNKCTKKTTLHLIEYVFDGWPAMTKCCVFLCDSCYKELMEGK